jgi:ParB family chromosome partitioning protein
MYQEIPTESVRPAPDNLRRRVGDVSDIVASIPTHGIIEPLVVTPQDDGTYLIVAGHRRHAAAVKAELATVPCIVRPMSDEERVLAALIENGARNDLRPTEDAGGYFRLVEGGWRIKDLAAATGRSARHVSTGLALLQLPAAVRSKLDQGKVSIADATELLRLKAHPQVPRWRPPWSTRTSTTRSPGSFATPWARWSARLGGRRSSRS